MAGVQVKKILSKQLSFKRNAVYLSDYIRYIPQSLRDLAQEERSFEQLKSESFQ